MSLTTPESVQKLQAALHDKVRKNLIKGFATAGAGLVPNPQHA
jgi:hypothetical protein